MSDKKGDIDDYVVLTDEEFLELGDSKKLNYVNSLVKIMKDLKVRADKNCAECKMNMLMAEDLNIDYLFEDWRGCSEHCEECGEEEKRNMCKLQFELINFIANEMGVLIKRQNALSNFVFKKDKKGKKVFDEIMDNIKKREKNKEIYM